MPQTYYLPNIRTLLTEGFSEDDLRTFCFDTPKFKPVHHELANQTGKRAIIQRLLEFAERQECLDALLAWAKTENPVKYEKYEPYFDGDTTPTPAELAELRVRYISQIINRYQNFDILFENQPPLPLEKFITLQVERKTEASGGKGITKIGEKGPISINEALQKNHRLIFIGNPGAGKTTLLKYITLAFAQNRSDRLGLNENRLPIFVRLYDYVAKRTTHPGDYSLVDYFYTQAHKQLLLDLPPGFFEAELDAGRCCVCLDGLDELGRVGERREMTAVVASLVSRYPHNRYLITSRIVGYAEAPLNRDDFIHYTVRPFNYDDDIPLFIKNWFEARETDPEHARRQAERLTKTILYDEPHLKTLATNPLMLTIIALVSCNGETDLPHERVKLYEKCIATLVKNWDEYKNLSVEDHEHPYYQRREALLEQLAFWLHESRARAVKEGDFKLQIGRFLLDTPKQLDEVEASQEAERFVALVKSRTGLLIERDGIYTFAHPTFQEYLAATHLKQRFKYNIDQMWQVIQPYLPDPHWHEVILLLLASLNEFKTYPTELVRRIFESTDDYEDVLHRHLFLAARALADRVNVEASLHNQIVGKLLAIARSDEWPRWDALVALGTIQGDEQAATGLLALAEDKNVDTNVGREAAKALGQLRQVGETVISGLVTLARDNTVDVLVRSDAALALGQLGRTNEATDVLLALVRDPTIDIGMRSYAVGEKLGQLGREDKSILAILLALARDFHVDDWIRYHAARTLGRLGQANEAVDLLLALARDPTVQPGDRLDAARALGQLGRTNEAAGLLLALACNRLVDSLVRYRAAEALGQLGRTDETTISSLLALARNRTESSVVRCTAAEALGQLGRTDETVFSGLLALVLDRSEQIVIRNYAAQALGQLGRTDEVILTSLLTLVLDPTVYYGLRCAAVNALGQLGQTDDAILSGLLTLGQDRNVDANIRYDAIRVLGQLRHTVDAAQLLLNLAQDRKVEVDIRCKAVQALSQLGYTDEAILSGLMALAQAKNVATAVRRAAAQALGQLGCADETILSGLMALAQAKNVAAAVRMAAAQALGLLGRVDDAAQLLLALAQNQNVDAIIRGDAYFSLKALLWKDEGLEEAEEQG
jgi:hypothetical protein